MPSEHQSEAAKQPAAKPREADERDAEIADLKHKLAQARAERDLASLTLQRYQEPDREQLRAAYARQLAGQGEAVSDDG